MQECSPLERENHPKNPLIPVSGSLSLAQKSPPPFLFPWAVISFKWDCFSKKPKPQRVQVITHLFKWLNKLKEGKKNPFKLWNVCLYSCIKINLSPDTRTCMDLPQQGSVEVYCKTNKKKPDKQRNTKRAQSHSYTAQIWETWENPWSKDFCKIVSDINQLKGAHYKFPKPDQITVE